MSPLNLNRGHWRSHELEGERLCEFGTAGDHMLELLEVDAAVPVDVRFFQDLEHRAMKGHERSHENWGNALILGK